MIAIQIISGTFGAGPGSYEFGVFGLPDGSLLAAGDLETSRKARATASPYPPSGLHQPPDPISASPKPKLVPADPKLWRQGFLDLRLSVVPCTGFTLQSWGATHEKCVDYLDRWADQAVGLGWTTLECLGLHPQIGTIRPDFCGAMMLSGERVSGITDTRMRFVNKTFYRDTPGRPSGAVPLWRFGK